MTATDAAPTTGSRRRTWRTLGAGWRWFFPVIIGNAIVQALLVTGDPLIESTVRFGLRVLASALSIVVAASLAVCVAAASAAGSNRPGPTSTTRLVRTAAWASAFGVLAAAASVLVVWLGPLVLLVGALLLPTIASGRPARAFLAAVPRAPIAYALLVVGTLVLIAASWLVALLLGFFVGDTLGAGLTWIWLGLVGTTVLSGSAAAGARGRRPRS